MTAGLPGVGIGGLFYLLCALLMPFTELGRTFAGRSSRERWRSVLTQFVMALVMVATVTAVIWGVRVMFAPTTVVTSPAPGSGSGSGGSGAVVEHVVRVTPHLPIALVLLSYLLLGVVLLAATVLRYVVVGRKPAPRVPTTEPATVPRPDSASEAATSEATTEFRPPGIPGGVRAPAGV